MSSKCLKKYLPKITTYILQQNTPNNYLPKLLFALLLNISKCHLPKITASILLQIHQTTIYQKLLFTQIWEISYSNQKSETVEVLKG